MKQENKPPRYDDEIVIGKIAKSFGVRGHLKVFSLTDFPERFKKLKQVHLYSEKSEKFLQDADGENEFTIENAELLPAFIKLKFKHISDKDEADKLRDYVISIPLDERIEREEGEHYYYELIGCEMWNGDELIGTVKVIEDFGGGDLFKVELKNDTKNEVYIPYRDEFIEKIDLSARKIYVKLIDGLIE